jgi:hypothetical protein
MAARRAAYAAWRLISLAKVAQQSDPGPRERRQSGECQRKIGT